MVVFTVGAKEGIIGGFCAAELLLWVLEVEDGIGGAYEYGLAAVGADCVGGNRWIIVVAEDGDDEPGKECCKAIVNRMKDRSRFHV
jgi:hypothetical protein